VSHASAAAVDGARLLDTAVALVGVPSPTCEARAVADRLTEILRADGFAVERPDAGWPEAPAVVCRWSSGRPGRTLQFNGHLDTVHLPFAGPQVVDGHLTGSGAADMKGGIAAAVEALRALRDSDGLPAGDILLTAHDQHEGPWGDGRQAEGLIAAGVTGDAVLVPEYLGDRLPGAGRGMAIFEVRLTRPGEAVHEVLRPEGLADVLAAGAELVGRLRGLDAAVATHTHPIAGRDSLFVGQIESGEIYNQAPVLCRVRGTRRWVTPGRAAAAETELRDIAREVAAAYGAEVALDFDVMGDAFELTPEEGIVAALQAAHAAETGAALPWGDKPFLDDANRFCRAGIPAVTHGPRGTGAHTTSESVAVAELERVARTYATTAALFCPAEGAAGS
jgi:succinyl-diaminopimelate desuccinylase